MVKFIDTEKSRMVVARGWERGRWKGASGVYCLMGTECQFCKRRKEEMGGGDACKTNVNIFNVFNSKMFNMVNFTYNF